MLKVQSVWRCITYIYAQKRYGTRYMWCGYTYKGDICMRKTRFCEPLDMDYPQKTLPSAGTCTASFSDRLRWPFAATNAKTNNVIHNEWLLGFYRYMRIFYRSISTPRASIYMGWRCFCWANFVCSRVGSDDAGASYSIETNGKQNLFIGGNLMKAYIPHNHTPPLCFACLLHAQTTGFFFFFLCNCEGKLELLPMCYIYIYMNWLLTNYVWWEKRFAALPLCLFGCSSGTRTWV